MEIYGSGSAGIVAARIAASAQPSTPSDPVQKGTTPQISAQSTPAKSVSAPEPGVKQTAPGQRGGLVDVVV